MSTNPFGTAAPVVEAAPVAAPVVEAAPVAAPVAAAPVAAAPATNEKKKDRKKPNKQATMDQKKFVISNYATMGRSEIAEATELTGQQVYNIIKAVRDAGDERATALRENGDEAGAVAVEAKIAAAFPKKMSGGKGGGRKKGTDVNTLLDELLA